MTRCLRNNDALIFAITRHVVVWCAAEHWELLKVIVGFLFCFVVLFSLTERVRARSFY